jgi:hypothetical protein
LDAAAAATAADNDGAPGNSSIDATLIPSARVRAILSRPLTLSELFFAPSPADRADKTPYTSWVVARDWATWRRDGAAWGFRGDTALALLSLAMAIFIGEGLIATSGAPSPPSC